MKAIITDLDRTLLLTDKTLSAYSISILKRCREQGLAIFAATARPERSVVQYREQVDFDGITTMNGARILLPDSAIENGIAHESGWRILSNLIAIPNVRISVETSDGIFSNVDIPEWNTRLFDGFPLLPTQGTIYKILLSMDDGIPDNMEALLTEDTYYTVANHYLVQIMSGAATKWKGIQEMLTPLGISPDDAIYFGDDQDDLEPIRRCGLGVAVSNGIPAVLEAADVITDSNDRDGVARFLERELL